MTSGQVGAEDDFARQLREALTRPIAEDEGLTPGGRMPPVGGPTTKRDAEAAERAARTSAGLRGRDVEPIKASSDKHPGYKPCPGCGQTTLAHLLCCRRCWAKLPRTEREGFIRASGRDQFVIATAVGALIARLRSGAPR